MAHAMASFRNSAHGRPLEPKILGRRVYQWPCEQKTSRIIQINCKVRESLTR